MELRPRKDRNSSSSKLPAPSPMSGKAMIQRGSSCMTSASLSSRRKATRAQKSSSSIGPLSSKEEGNRKSGNSPFKKTDAEAASSQNASRSGVPRSAIMVSSTMRGDMKETKGSHKTNENDATPQSRLTEEGRLRSSRRKMVARVTKEVDANKVICRAGQEDRSMRPTEADTVELESNPMEVIKNSSLKLDNENSKRTQRRSNSQKRQETNRKLFEDVFDGKMDAKDSNCRRIELSHQDKDEKGQNMIGQTPQGNSPCGMVLIASGPKEKSHQSPNRLTNGVKELSNIIHSGTSTLGTIPIANVHLDNSNLIPANLTNARPEDERTTLKDELPDTHGYKAVDEKDRDCRGYVDGVEKARFLGEKQEGKAETRQSSCPNLQESILREEQFELGNQGRMQCEGYGEIGSGLEEEAYMSPQKALKERTASLQQIIEQKAQEKLDCTKNGNKTSCHRENNQELSLDDNAIFSKSTGDRGENEVEIQGLEFSGKKETTFLDAFVHHGSDILTDSDKDNYIEKDNSEADGTTFQVDLKIRRKEEDDNDDEDEDEDEEEMANLFVRSLKAHLQQPSDQSIFVNMQKDVAKVGQGEKGEKILSKVASKKLGQSSFNSSRFSSIGLSWLPETGLQLTKTDKCPGRNCIDTLKGTAETIWQKEGKLIDGLLVPPVDPIKINKLSRKQMKDTAGAKWYDLSAPTVTPELKKDLQLLKLRNVVDPKRHYKSEDSKGLPKYFQVGTVVGGPADFYSGRLTKKERKSTFSDELLSDSILSAFRKRKYAEIQEQKQAGGKKIWKKKKSNRTPCWART